MAGEYDPLAEVDEWLVPDNLLEPEGAMAAFAMSLSRFRPADEFSTAPPVAVSWPWGWRCAATRWWPPT